MGRTVVDLMRSMAKDEEIEERSILVMSLL
jgi:hypothetical protein